MNILWVGTRDKQYVAATISATVYHHPISSREDESCN
jgi:hypothetical protein